MADDKRDYVDEYVEQAQTGRRPGTPPDERRRNPRGRTGVSRPVSPRPGVRDPGPAREGEFGEPAYGAPTSPPPPQERGERERQARPDPLKQKPKPKPKAKDKDDKK